MSSGRRVQGARGGPSPRGILVAVDRVFLAAADGDLPGSRPKLFGTAPRLGGLVAAVDLDLVVGDGPTLPVDPVAELVEVALAVNLEQGGLGLVGRQDRVAGQTSATGSSGRPGELSSGRARRRRGRSPGGGHLDRLDRLALGLAVAVDQGPPRGDRDVVEVEVDRAAGGDVNEVAADPDQAVLDRTRREAGTAASGGGAGGGWSARSSGTTAIAADRAVFPRSSPCSRSKTGRPCPTGRRTRPTIGRAVGRGSGSTRSGGRALRAGGFPRDSVSQATGTAGGGDRGRVGPEPDLRPSRPFFGPDDPGQGAPDDARRAGSGRRRRRSRGS